MSAMFTCITCAVAFKEPEAQREHYKTDWHRYNLKRKMAELPPITEKDFKSKMAKHEEQRKVLNGETKAPTGYCVACSKSFSTEKAYANHLKSKKHLEAAKIFDKKANKDEIEMNRRNRKLSQNAASEANVSDDDMEVEEVDSDEWDEEEEEDGSDPVPTSDCLFCGHHSANLDKDLSHMMEAHTFFLPDAEFIVDLDGLMNYLCAKVGQGRMCLWCNEKSKRFRSLDAVRKHMLDKGHCKIDFHGGDAMMEFADFYDYSTSYPEDHPGSVGTVDPDVPGPSNGDSIGDEEVEIDTLDDSSYELVLPSGAKIGHRSLIRYYKQSLNPNRELVLRKPNQRMIETYRTFGWTGLSGKEAKMKARDQKFMRSAQQKYFMKLRTRANKLQRHFRDPTM